jgi:hypothetical protein
MLIVFELKGLDPGVELLGRELFLKTLETVSPKIFH